ncbi:M23 family metallopeptidase [Modestobacter sp. NPDC049651]|uniref:M23 family metallopeptidase n=1 Tax=unclassified Modestobacter TaxID=2643866 RepID=UPI0033F8AE20
MALLAPEPVAALVAGDVVGAPRLRPVRPRGADGRWLSDAAIAAGADAVRPGAVSPSGNVVALLPPEEEGAGSAAAVVADIARGRFRRLRSARRRPLAVAAVLAGAAGVVLTTTALGGPASGATDAAPVSVAEELGLEQAQPSTASADELSSRLGLLAADRAAREDAQAQAAAAQADADAAAAAAAQAAAEAAAANRAVLPVEGARLSSGFGARWGTLHAGLDFAAPLGTPEHAAMDGVVLRAGPASGFGLAVYVQHANGDVTVYGHMQEILVAEGQTVKAGDTIALLGQRGQSTGPHLHFEVHVGGIDGQKIDPLPWLREHGAPL